MDTTETKQSIDPSLSELITLLASKKKDVLFIFDRKKIAVPVIVFAGEIDASNIATLLTAIRENIDAEDTP